MEYVAYRVENGVLENNKFNYDKWLVRGQRKTDLNHDLLIVCGSENEAKAWALTHRALNGKRGWCPVYNNAGYGYKDVDPMH